METINQLERIKLKIMKKLLLLLSIVLAGCSKEDIPTPQSNIPTCYKILTWADDPDGDYITIIIAPYKFQSIKVNNYRDYMGKTEVCDLTKVK